MLIFELQVYVILKRKLYLIYIMTAFFKRGKIDIVNCVMRLIFFNYYLFYACILFMFLLCTSGNNVMYWSLSISENGPAYLTCHVLISKKKESSTL